jgi:hypothetical protein
MEKEMMRKMGTQRRKEKKRRKQKSKFSPKKGRADAVLCNSTLSPGSP